jgi:hypothetical protein
MNDTNQGWKQVDEWYLNKYDNAQADPDIQILTEDNYEDENKELREYYCAICHGKLDFIKNMDTWYCEACVQYYDTKVQDVPIKNINDGRVKMYAELEHYHQLDDDDIYLSFVEGVNPDENDEEYVPSNIEIVTDDGHHRHIRVKGDITKALAAMNQMD